MWNVVERTVLYFRNPEGFSQSTIIAHPVLSLVIILECDYMIK